MGRIKPIGGLAIVIGLSGLGLWLQPSFKKQSKSPAPTEAYWAETDLSPDYLKELVSDLSCSVSTKSFLSCINAISSSAAKLGYKLDAQGELKKLTEQDRVNTITEKQDLEKWQVRFEAGESSLNFEALLNRIVSEAQAQDRVPPALVYGAGINGFMSVSKDPHSYIIPYKMYEDLIAKSEIVQFHSGLLVRRISGKVIIKKVYTDSVAEIKNLKKGDELISVNDQELKKMRMSEVNDLLRFKDQAELNIVYRDSQGRTRKVKLEKTENHFVAVDSEVIESTTYSGSARRVGLVTINKFAKSICKQVKSEIQILKEKAIEGLILDLRDNPGGQVDEAACVIGLFVNPGTLLFETKYLEPFRESDKYYAKGPQLYRGSLSVLINSGSASASEIVAGSLKDLVRASLVGERTFGKGSFQDGRIWSGNDQFALFETAGLYYFPSGWTAQLEGVKPDVTVQYLSSDDGREEELYFNPIRPTTASLTFPSSVSLDLEPKCSDLSFETQSTNTDPQVATAENWMLCKSANDRYSRL